MILSDFFILLTNKLIFSSRKSTFSHYMEFWGHICKYPLHFILVLKGRSDLVHVSRCTLVESQHLLSFFFSINFSFDLEDHLLIPTMSISGLTKIFKQRSVDPGFSGSNPFDSDSESDPKQTTKPIRTSSAPEIPKVKFKPTDSGYNVDEERGDSSHSVSSAAKNRYKSDFSDSGGLENQSVQELENYAVYKAEETTEKVNSCLKIAEDIREDATKTLVTLNQQGEQITRTHMTAANIDQDLSRGEKLLGSLGGIFSKTWKPKKTRPITGPVITKNDSFKRRGSHLEQRERLGLTSSSPTGRPNHRKHPSAPTALQKVEIEKEKQDDGISDLSNILGQLKDMAIDMGSEIERQNKALDHLSDDVDELNYRVKGANQRGRRLLGK